MRCPFSVVRKGLTQRRKVFFRIPSSVVRFLIIAGVFATLREIILLAGTHEPCVLFAGKWVVGNNIFCADSLIEYEEDQI